MITHPTLPLLFDHLRRIVGYTHLADALFDDYFIACESCDPGINLVARAQYVSAGSWAAATRPNGVKYLFGSVPTSHAA